MKFWQANLLASNTNPTLGADDLADLDDVEVTLGAGVDGYVLYYDHSSAKFKLQAASTPGAHALDSHSDVDVSGASTGEALFYDGADWINAPIEVADIDDLTASAAELNLLDLSGLTAGHVLRATGAATAAWGALLLTQISGINFSSILENQFVKFNASSQLVNFTPDLSDLSDVEVSTPSSGQTLIYNTGNNRFENGTLSSTWSGAVVKNADAAEAANPLTWTAAVYDPDSLWDSGGDPSKIIVPAGKTKARVRAFLNFGSGQVSSAEVKKNGTVIAAGSGGGLFTVDHTNASETVIMINTTLFDVTENDYIEIKASSIPDGDSWFEVELFAL